MNCPFEAKPYILVISGSEILIGKRKDAHVSFLTRTLSPLGLVCQQCIIVGDKIHDLTAIVRNAFKQTDLVIMTGGLGPTVDDLTREALSEALGIGLKEDPEALAMIQQRFDSMGRKMSDNNRRQALVPEQGFFILNPHGTAPGLVFDAGQKIAIALPGPPQELEPMVHDSVIPFFKERLQVTQNVLSHSFRFCCLGESTIDSFVQKHFGEDKKLDVSLLSHLGTVDLTLLLPKNDSSSEEKLENYCSTIRNKIGQYIYSETGESLEEVVGSLLKQRGETVSVAESCTGGLLGSAITQVAGCSNYFLGGAIAYQNRIKERTLGVQNVTLETYGAVSQQTAEEMARGALEVFQADWAVSITGVAGPGGGSEEKPVGTVWLCVSNKNGERYPFRGNFIPGRESIRRRSVVTALDQLRRALLGIRPHRND